MIQIRNITRGTSTERRVAISTKSQSTLGFPRLLDLTPGATITIAKQNLRDYAPAVKQEIADFVAHGFLQVVACNSSHLYQDRGNACDYSYDYLLPAAQALALEHALQVAVSLDTCINTHVQSTAFHNAATAVIGVAVPTDLASLLLWIAGAQTAYETVHRPSFAAHPFVDAVNTLAPVAAVDLASAIQALQEIYRAFDGHRTWLVGSSTLSVPTIMTF
jgi:hypothetical protein